MKIKNNQSGVAHLTALFVVVVVVVIGFVGWKVWGSRTSKTELTSSNSATKQLTKKEEVQSVDRTKGWKTYNASFKLVPASEGTANFSFKYPPDWKATTGPVNSADFTSPDYISQEGFSYITAGSALLVSAEANPADINGHTPTLEEIANNSMGIRNTRSFKVNGDKAFEYESDGAENQSLTHQTLILHKGNIYRIQQMYKLKVDNPYPDLVKSVLSSLKFGV
mgnify:CR=1 FL=1